MQDREELWRTGTDEPVQVNQRALIDKVLARYSGEFTLFRELLQNSDDARSRVVEIHFETAQEVKKEPRTLVDLVSTSAVQWTFRNDGDAFTEKDWTRLPRIAEGNPGPEKIGAFGVGFYSLFSVTDRPFVSSGGHGMQFYWKDDKDQLYVRRGDLPLRETLHPWTTFEMPLREAGPLPPTLELMRFLASSITFMVNLKEVRVFVDEHCIGCIKKVTGTIQAIDVPAELIDTSPSGIMNVKEIRRHPITIEAEVAHAVYATGIGKPPFQGVVRPRNGAGFFVSNQSLTQPRTETAPQQPVDPARMYRSTVDLTVFTAEVNVELDKKLLAELLRSTKKEPPKRLTYGLIYTGKDGYDRSVVDSDQGGPPSTCESIFQGLRADLNGAMHTRIFIGHATGQTTGVGGHMASYFIPTVERESIDLIDRNIAIWNEELLYVGGFLCRAVYELELSKIQHAWEVVPEYDSTPEFRPPAALQESLDHQFLHILKFFTFHRSTPSPKVARLLETAFYGCSTAPLRLLSSAGVRTAPEIKEFDSIFAGFLKYLPMLPQYVMTECPRVIKALPDKHKISPITFSDVLQDLRGHTLSRDELVSCLRWWTTCLKQGDLDRSNTSQLLGAITLSHSAIKRALQLSSVEFFFGSECSKARVPLDGPLPPSLMPHDITTKFLSGDLMNFGWQEFTVTDWLRHISQPEVMSIDPDHDFTQSIEWSERILGVLSGVLLSEKLQRTARSIFRGRNCIPTTHGLRSPEESFLSSTNITLFRDLGLPIVRFKTGLENKGDVEGFLSSIGVRKHVPPQLLLDRMAETGNWSIADLIGYLVHVQGNLTADEFTRLKSFEAFTQEGAQGNVGERPRYRALDLYPPLDIFRQLHLPVIDWGVGSKWRNESDHAELLYRLGLCRYPPLEMMIELCASPDAAVRETAFKYLCDNLRSNYSHYNVDNFRHVAFIPAEDERGTCLAKLDDVCLGTRWKALGFFVVQDHYRKTLVTELGVQQHPPTSRLIQLLEAAPPTNEDVARQWFECLFECIPSFSQRELTRLSELPIVPRRSPSGSQQLAPMQCYLGEGAKDEFHAKLFVFVDFGSTANRFLKACGSKNEPSVKDIAESLVEDPKRFYELAGGHEGFLGELRDLASRSRRIPNITLSKMMSKPILLGFRRKKTTDGQNCEYELREPAEIVIADDTNSQELFEDSIFVAPQELEAFYASLGCRRLSTVVQEKYKVVSKAMQDTKTSTKVQALVLQRLPLFLREGIQLQVPASWVPSAENFKVKVCEKLLMSKTLTIGSYQTTREQNVWAATKCDEEGRIELWLSGNAEAAELDMYEIAACLCRLLLGTAKVSDTLLLTTILSTPLDILKRRGYNVDKISRRDGEQLEELTEEVHDRRCVPPAATTISTIHKASEQSVTAIDPSTVVASSESSANQPIPTAGGSGAPLVNSPSPTLVQQSVDHTSNNVRNPIQILTRRFVPRVRTTEVRRSTPFPQPSWTPRQVIPQSYIRANVNKAIKVCNPEGGKLLHHRNKIEEIREFPNVGYCDLSGQAGKLKRRGKMGHVKVFTTEDIPDVETFMTSMHNILARFIGVLTPLAELYGVSLDLLHVFYDMAGGPIAFNREGSIFLNLRYFEAWHDQDVQKGERKQAQISWFLALAHELAHNLIKQHNSEHEFWFSAICEAHISAFSRLLRPMSE